ncbi:hypothetical protein A2U01_0060707, partial [Trifolium medium]|nr:hypothetical protein [Trifolium medium]
VEVEFVVQNVVVLVQIEVVFDVQKVVVLVQMVVVLVVQIVLVEFVVHERRFAQPKG